jgi:hypothetical protein
MSANILATDYYDGATEGFVVQPADAGVKYFRLIAWDSEQDRRLFVIADVDSKELSRLEDLLKASGQSPKEQTWLPEWRFSGSCDAAEADDIVERCRSKLRETGQFGLGNRPDASKSLGPVTRVLQQDVLEAINRNAAGDLDEWLAKLRR